MYDEVIIHYYFERKFVKFILILITGLSLRVSSNEWNTQTLFDYLIDPLNQKTAASFLFEKRNEHCQKFLPAVKKIIRAHRSNLNQLNSALETSLAQDMHNRNFILLCLKESLDDQRKIAKTAYVRLKQIQMCYRIWNSFTEHGPDVP